MVDFEKPQPDLPRADRPLDLRWWTGKLFDELAYSEFGEFEPDRALEAVKEKYGVQEPGGDAFWQLQDRLTLIEGHNETDFNHLDLKKIIDDMTMYDGLEGEQ